MELSTSSFKKDKRSGAVLNVNSSELQRFQYQRENAKVTSQILSEMENLKKQLAEVRAMMQPYLANK